MNIEPPSFGDISVIVGEDFSDTKSSGDEPVTSDNDQVGDSKDLDCSYFSDSEMNDGTHEFKKLDPLAYDYDSFVIGTFIRYADEAQQTQFYAIVSKVGVLSIENEFELHLRLMGNCGPSSNYRCLTFPNDFHELFIDTIQYQHPVTDLKSLVGGEHIRFTARRS